MGLAEEDEPVAEKVTVTGVSPGGQEASAAMLQRWRSRDPIERQPWSCARVDPCPS